MTECRDAGPTIVRWKASWIRPIRDDYSIPIRSIVRIVVFDNLGREVAVLKEGYQDPGNHQVSFNGAGLPSGTYFYRLQVGGKTMTRSITLLK